MRLRARAPREAKSHAINGQIPWARHEARSATFSASIPDGECVVRFGPTLLVGLASSVLAPSSAAHAWGAAGHEIVGELAQSYVAPLTAAELEKLLPRGTRLADVANWADDYRKQCTNTGPWHSVNIPIAAAS